VAAAALKAATSVMQHVQPSNPAAFVNRLLQLYEQQESTGPAQDLSALLQLIILVRAQQQPIFAIPQSPDTHVN
jgi:hypothetical protein